MRRSFALIAGAAVLAAFGCSGNTQVTLAQLAEAQQTYAGRHVTTQGVVREERDPDGTAYFVLSNVTGQRVGLAPSETASRFRGRLVEVSGLFEVQPGFGRIIHISAIAPQKSAASTAPG